MTQEILQAAVFTLLAIPFIYMAYDVTRDLSLKTVRLVNNKIRPGITMLIGMMSK